MTVRELIDILNTIEDKSKIVGYSINGKFRTIDPAIGVNEYADVVELHYDITDIVKNAIKNNQ